MIELRPPGVATEIKAQPRLLLTHHWVQFSKGFPDALDFVRGKAMQVTKQQQVTYEKSYRLKESCYLDVNLSNEDTGLKLYPDGQDTLYEMLIALKLGNFYVIPYFPANLPVYTLDYPGVTPLVSDANYKYLGAVRPQDSPFLTEANAWALATFKLYLVFQQKPVILRVVCDVGVDYELCTIEFLINRCSIEAKPLPAGVTPKPILYLDEIRQM